MTNQVTLESIDQGKPFDWGKTSSDYAVHRPGPPMGLYTRLAALGVGLRGQKILDIATGTGVIARQLAKQGAEVIGIDIAPEQIAIARRLATDERLEIQFFVSDAHKLSTAGGPFDAVVASQCWWYFDPDVILPEIKHALRPDGALVVTHFNYLPHQDAVAAASEQLILKFNPKWTGANWTADVPPCPKWAEGRLKVKAMFYFDEDIPFTRESWRGRIRACRGVGASLSPNTVAQFDREHDELLKTMVGERFAVRHRIDAHVFEFQ